MPSRRQIHRKNFNSPELRICGKIKVAGIDEVTDDFSRYRRHAKKPPLSAIGKRKALQKSIILFCYF